MLMRLAPDYIVKDVTEISLEFLKKHGIRYLLIDLDNTLIPRNEEKMDDHIKNWIKNIADGSIKVYVISNNWEKRVKEALKEVHIDGFIAPAGKPFVIKAKKFLRKHKIDPKLSAFVGDQVFTDLIFGKKLNLFTILVEPLSDYDLPHTKLLRIFERKLLKRWKELEKRGRVRRC